MTIMATLYCVGCNIYYIDRLGSGNDDNTTRATLIILIAFIETYSAIMYFYMLNFEPYDKTISCRCFLLSLHTS